MQGDTSPAERALAVTPSDSAALDAGFPVRGLFIGTGGNVAFRLMGDKSAAPAVVLKNVPSGTFLPVVPRHVMATGTSATDIVALG